MSSHFTFSKRSLTCLDGVHTHLRAISERALELSPTDFGISEGLRSIERQARLFARGASQTMNSRHLSGHAIDIYPYIDGKAVWEREAFLPIARSFKTSALELYEIVIIWGGDWESFEDCPHFELPREVYAI